MSGGSMNYLFSRIEEAHFAIDTPERKAFKIHLEKVAKACKAIEWVDSGDSSEGAETAAILECIDRQDILAQLIIEAKMITKQLNQWTVV